MSKETLNLILTLAFVAVFVIALIGGLVGLIKGLYKTTVKTIIKAILVVIAVFTAPAIASLLANMDVSSILSNFGQQVEKGTTLQSFIVNYMYDNLSFSPVNGMTLYETCIVLANSIIAFVVFILELIIIQLVVSLLTTLIYQTIIRWIIPVESKKEKKARKKALKEGIVSEGLKDDDGNIDGKKHRKKLHLYQWPGFLIGFAQQFVFVCLLLMPLSSVCKIATKNSQLIKTALSMTGKVDDQTMENIDGYLETAENSPLLKMLGVGNIDSKLISKATTVNINSTGGEMDFLSLVNQIVDVASPVIENNSIEYDTALGQVTLNLSQLLSVETVDALITKLIASPTVISLIPALIDVALNYVKGATIAIDQIDLSNINWGSINKDGTKEGELAIIADIYKCIYSTAIEPLIVDNKFDLSNFSLKLSNLTTEQRDQLLQAFEDLGKLESVKRNMGILLSSLGSMLESTGFKLLSTNYEDYANVNWSNDLKLIGQTVIDFFPIVEMDLSPSINMNELLDKLINCLKEPDKLKQIATLIVGSDTQKGILQLDLINTNCISLADLLDSVFSQIPALQPYISNINFRTIFDDLQQVVDGVLSEFKIILNMAEEIFSPNSKIDLNNLQSIDLKDQDVADTLCNLLDISKNSKIFTSLFPSIIKSLLFNDQINISSFLFGLSPYNFNYNDIEFVDSLKGVIKLLPSIMTMANAFSDSNSTIEDKVNAIEIDTIKKLLIQVVNNEFFNSDQRTGVTSNYQHNLNISTLIKGLFDNKMFKQLKMLPPTDAEISNINWGNGEDSGEIYQICKIFTDIKDMGLATLLSKDEISLKDMPSGKDFKTILTDGMGSTLLSSSIVSLIDNSLNSYFQSIGIPLTLNQMRNQYWIDDSDKLARILDILKQVDLNDFDLNTLDSNLVNCLLTQLSKTHIVATSSDKDDPFGFLVYSLLKKQKVDSKYYNYSTFDLTNTKDNDGNQKNVWSKSTKLEEISYNGNKITSTLDEDGKFPITDSGELSTICDFIKIALEKGLNEEVSSMGAIIRPLLDSANDTMLNSYVIRNLLLNVCIDYQFSYGTKMPLKFQDFINSINFKIMKDQDDSESLKTDLAFLGQVDDLLISDANDRLPIYTNNSSQSQDSWQKYAYNTTTLEFIFNNMTSLNNYYIDIDVNDATKGKQTLKEKLDNLLDSMFASRMMKSKRPGHLLSPLQQFYHLITNELGNDKSLFTLCDSNDNSLQNDAFNSILVSIDDTEWDNEVRCLKSIIDNIQGTNFDAISDFDITNIDKATLEGILTNSNKSKILHRLPISIIKKIVTDYGFETLTYNKGVKLYDLPFDKYTTINGDLAGNEAIIYWQHDIDLFVQFCLGDDEYNVEGILNTIKTSGSSGGKGTLGDLDFSQLKSEYLYYIGDMHLFKDTRSYIVYNLISEYGKADNSNNNNNNTTQQSDFNMSKLFLPAENTPYGEDKYVYRIDELLFKNPDLIDANDNIIKEKMMEDLSMLDDVFDYILANTKTISGSNLNDINDTKMNFEYLNNCCYKIENNSISHRCKMASEIVAGLETLFIKNTNVSASQTMNPLADLQSIDLYANDYEKINTIEGRFFDGLIKLLNTTLTEDTPNSYKYYTKVQLEAIFTFFGNSQTPTYSAPFDQTEIDNEADLRTKTYMQNVNSKYSSTNYDTYFNYFKSQPKYLPSSNSILATTILNTLKSLPVKLSTPSSSMTAATLGQLDSSPLPAAIQDQKWTINTTSFYSIIQNTTNIE